MTYDLSDMPAGHWNDEQVVEAMRRIAVAEAETRGNLLFLTIEEAFALDASTEVQDWAIGVADAMTLNLITCTEQVATDLGFSSDQTCKLIGDRVGALRSRLLGLGLACTARGRA